MSLDSWFKWNFKKMVLWCINESETNNAMIFRCKIDKNVCYHRIGKWNQWKMSKNVQSKAPARRLTYASQGLCMWSRSRIRRFILTYIEPQEHTCIHKYRAAYAWIQAAYIGPSPRMQEHRQKQFYDIFKEASSKIHLRQVPIPPRTLGFPLNPSYSKTQAFR